MLLAGLQAGAGVAGMARGVAALGAVGFERPLFFLALPVALAAVAVLFYWNVGSGAPTGRTRTLMIATRVLVAVLLVTAAAGPYVVDVSRSAGEPEVQLLVDDSESMDVYDVDAESIAESIEAEGVPVRRTTVASGASSPIGDEVLRSIEAGSHVVLLSDGRVTEGRNLGFAVDVAAERNATISALRVDPARPERLVRVEAPETTTAGAEESIRVSVGGVGETDATLTVTVDGEQVREETVSDPTSIELEHTFEKAGDHRIEATIDADDGGFDRNTVFRRVVRVVEPPEVLYVSRVDYPLETYLGELYDVTRAESVPDRDALDRYHAVVIQDVAAGDIGDVGALQSYAADGNGVVVAGGNNAYGRGGYASSSIATMLPVRFDEAIGGDDVVLVVDVSGSAEETMPRIRGLSLDILEQIGDESRLGVVAFDSRAQVVSELRPLESERTELQATIRRLQAGGGTDIGAGLRAAGGLLEGDGEVILITDGVDDSEQALVAAEELAAENVRVTGVGFGYWSDDDRLAEIAGATGGTYIQPDETERLRLFFDSGAAPPEADSLVVVDRTHFITDGVETESDPTSANDVEARDGARLLVTTSEGDPAVTSWRFGLGRVVSVTAYDADGSLGGLLSPPDAELTTRSVNWAIGDPRRKRTDVASVDDTSRGAETRVVYRGATRPTGTDLEFVRTDTERFEATFTPEAVGYDSVLDAGYAVNYAAEYGAVGQASAVEAAIDRTGGRAFDPSEAAAIAEFTRSEATRERAIQRPFGWVLLAIALFVYLGEVAARRLGEIYDAGDTTS
ncbi:von Willebrand factor type A domain protein [Natronomonas moolapensis 8.8.11]|uniref:von Willebrand factor type A domain protein n=1 Tax=Natronomonas moolapensis (strain DSM 18674 / CECT 7526 / JCM 14361 / 8.8.11) TaxID=268739 RepID=M1XSN1_NATM8|nr:vWA domain-containing protein [Natronomonas moolapensis]CCQ37393.1 von Willebrand factor type A domain protein [Natronomonas moolapensis 8.8.11]